MEDPAPSWQVLKYSLEVVLSKFKLDELSSVGSSQRLPFVILEVILYHLFLLIDANDCKRRFRSIYPTRNSSEQTRFLDQVVTFINNKKLIPKQVTPSQFRCCGGEQFRRLLGLMINKAVEFEMKSLGNISNILADCVEDKTNGHIDYDLILNNYLVKTREILDQLNNKHIKAIERLEKNINHNKLNQQADHIYDINNPPNRKDLLAMIQEKIALIYDLWDKLEVSRNKIQSRREKDNEAIATATTLNSPKQQAETKRISQIIREVQESIKSPKVNMTKKLHEDLTNNLNILHLELEEQVFKLQEVQDLYHDLKANIAPLKIKPIAL